MIDCKDLKKWIKEIQNYIEWNIETVEQAQRMRERGYDIFAYDTRIAIDSIKLRIEDLNKILIPNIKECKKIRKNLEDSMKYRIKGFEQEIKYFNDIPKSLTGRFGSGSVTFNISMSDNLLKEAIKDFGELTHLNK